MATKVSTPERKVNVEERGHNGHSSSSSRTRLTSSPLRPTNTQLSLESVLQSAQGNTMSALEAVLNERNLLSTQNSQLWKLVEKQRNVHATATKELERVRAERDRAHAMLREDTGARTTKSPDPPALTSRSEASSPVTERPTGRRTPTAQSHTDVGHSRHSSKPSGSLFVSRSHEPIRSQTDDPKRLSPTTEGEANHIGNGNYVPSTSRTPSPNRVMSEPHPVNAPPEPSLIAARHDQSQPLASKSQEAAHLHAHSHKQPALSSVSNPQTTGISNASSLHSATTTELPSSSRLTVPLRDRALARESRITLPDEARRYIASLQDSPMASPTSYHNNFATITEEPSSMEQDIHAAAAVSKPHDEDHATSIPSHVPPEQTLRTPSPRALPAEHRSDKRVPSEERRTAEDPRTSLHVNKVVPDRKRAMTPPPAQVHHGAVPMATPRIPDRDRTPQPWRTPSRPEPTVSTATSREVNASLDAISPVSVNTKSPVSQSASGLDINSSVTPKANSFQNAPNSNTRAQVQAQRLAYAQAQSQAQAPPPAQAQTQPHTQNQMQVQGYNSSRASPQDRSPSDRGRSNEVAPERVPEHNAQRAYLSRSTKRMYLVDGDLQQCQVNVVGSHIRANDRGKEVLSFSIEVSLAEKESSWKVEKLYSDVLALDSKIRARLSRSNAKKLAHLPDSKLFKDNAPAKVDQRKVELEVYLRSVTHAAVSDTDDICDFFSTDIINEANAPVAQMGYKEGYLTKRGKNFGGWKTRYFVLQGPSLEYYESRGGTHLGHINITGAQIGRQQRPSTHPDDENEYRHAFLILEKKPTPAGHQRHVLCAQSDTERDSWVDVLVRYVTGTYDDTGASSSTAALPLTSSSVNVSTTSQPRPSTSSVVSHDSTITPSKRQAKGNNNTPVPSHDQSKHLQAGSVPGSSTSSPLEHYLPQQLPEQAVSSDNLPISSSLPTQLSAAGGGILSQRAASEMGHYPDLGGITQHYQEPQKTSHRQDRQHARTSVHPGLHPLQTNGVSAVTTDISPNDTPKVKISGPINGTPIPPGYKFGARDAAAGAESGSERERKVKSRSFWPNFSRHNGQNNNPIPRTVFGVDLANALQVAQIANLPAVVFRCIQYLETKKADQEEGIYRLSGSSAVIKSLKDRFNTEGDVDLLGSDEFWDLNAIAGLLKSYLRELPDSILTRDLHMKFLTVIDLADQRERVDELAQLISRLPVANYSLLRAMTAHLILIVQNSSVNKMTMRNVGIVFSPTLGIPAGVFSLMLAEFHRVFNVDGDTAVEGEEDTATPDDDEAHLRTSKRNSVQNNRNSRSYADGAADQMLGLAGRILPQGDESDSADEITIPDSFSDVGSEGPDPDATAQLSRSDFEVPQPELVEEHADKSAANRTRKPDKASAVAASRGLQVSVGRGGGNFVGLPASPHPSARGA